MATPRGGVRGTPMNSLWDGALLASDAVRTVRRLEGGAKPHPPPLRGLAPLVCWDKRKEKRGGQRTAPHPQALRTERRDPCEADRARQEPADCGGRRGVRPSAPRSCALPRGIAELTSLRGLGSPNPPCETQDAHRWRSEATEGAAGTLGDSARPGCPVPMELFTKAGGGGSIC